MIKENFRHLVVISGNSNLNSNTMQQGSVPIDSMRSVLSIKDIVRAYAEMEAYKVENAKSNSSPKGKTGTTINKVGGMETDSTSTGEEKKNKSSTASQGKTMSIQRLDNLLR